MMSSKLSGLVAVVSLLILGMAWSAWGSGWVAAGVVATYWQVCFVAWRWRVRRLRRKAANAIAE